MNSLTNSVFGLLEIVDTGRRRRGRRMEKARIVLESLAGNRLLSPAVMGSRGLLTEPRTAVATYRDGVLVQVPRPERFAIHKLIVADRRLEGADRLKAVKDRFQAEFLIKALATDRPDDLHEALDDASSRGKRLREPIPASVNKMPVLKNMIGAHL